MGLPGDNTFDWTLQLNHVNLDTRRSCRFPDKDGEHLIESRKVQCRELFREEVDFVLVGLEGPSTLSTVESASSWAKTVHDFMVTNGDIETISSDVGTCFTAEGERPRCSKASLKHSLVP